MCPRSSRTVEGYVSSRPSWPTPATHRPVSTTTVTNRRSEVNLDETLHHPMCSKRLAAGLPPPYARCVGASSNRRQRSRRQPQVQRPSSPDLANPELLWSPLSPKTGGGESQRPSARQGDRGRDHASAARSKVTCGALASWPEPRAPAVWPCRTVWRGRRRRRQREPSARSPARGLP